MMEAQEIDNRLREIFRRNTPSFERFYLSAVLESDTRAPVPKRRRPLRIALSASIAVLLVAAITLGSLEAAKHLGSGQPILVITDDTTSGATTPDTTGGATTTATVGSVVGENVWTELQPSGPLPAGRYGHALAYDEDRGQMIMFGGWTIGSAERDGKTRPYAGTLDDTWSYDAESKAWTELHPTGAIPLSRYGHSLVYDSAGEKFILFGGSNSHEPGDIADTEQRSLDLADTWAYEPDRNAWQELTPEPSPSARFGQAMAYDSTRNLVLMFGGAARGVGHLNDTWIYDPGANEWSEVAPQGDSPSPRAAAAMVYDPTHDLFILFGGTATEGDANETWAYDPNANTWTMLQTEGAPRGRDSHAMVFDSSNDRIVLFGGIRGISDDEGPEASFLGDTWIYDVEDNSWMQMNVSSPSPEGRYSPGLAYDARRGSVVMFGGCPYGELPRSLAGGPLDDTWEYRPPGGTITASQTTSTTLPTPTTVRPLSAVVTPEIQGYLDALEAAWTKAGIPVLGVGIVPLDEGLGQEIAKSSSESDILPYVQVEVPGSLLEEDDGLFASYTIERQTIVTILRGVPLMYLAVVTVENDGTKTMNSFGLIREQVPAPGSEWEQPAGLGLEDTTQAIEALVGERAANAGVEIASIDVREDDSGRVVTVKAIIADVASADLDVARFGDAVGEDARRLTEEEGAKISEVDVAVDDRNGERVVRFAQNMMGGSKGWWYTPELWDLVNE